METTYKLYVTDLTKAHYVLKEAGYDCEPRDTYLNVLTDDSEKMNIIKKINEAHIVLLDIE